MTALAAALGLLVFGGAMFKGGHDLWIATAAYLAALLVAGAALVRDAWNPKAPGVDVPFAAAAAGLAAVFWLSLRSAARPEDAWLEAMDWSAAALVFILALRGFHSERDVEAFLIFPAGFALLWLFPILYERYEYLLIPSPATDTALKWFWRILGQDPTGSFPNSSAMAGFLILWLPALGHRALHSRTGPWRLLAEVSLLVFLLLNSVSGVLCLCAALLVALRDRVLPVFKRRPRALLAAVLGLAAAAAFFVWWKLSADWFGNEFGPAQRLARLGWWHAGLRMFLDHPWLGIGPGNYGAAYLAYRAPGIENTLFAHSLPVTLLAETGLAGTLGFAAFALYVVARALRAGLSPLRQAVLAGALGFLLFSTISIGAEYLAALLGLFLALGIAAAPAAHGGAKPSRALSLVLAAAALAPAPWILAPWLASRLIVQADDDLRASRPEDAGRRYLAASELDGRAWEARRGLARVHVAAFKASGDPRELWEAARRQREAVELDRMNRALRRELESYEDALSVLAAREAKTRPR